MSFVALCGADETQRVDCQTEAVVSTARARDMSKLRDAQLKRALQVQASREHGARRAARAAAERVDALLQKLGESKTMHFSTSIFFGEDKGTTPPDASPPTPTTWRLGWLPVRDLPDPWKGASGFYLADRSPPRSPPSPEQTQQQQLLFSQKHPRQRHHLASDASQTTEYEVLVPLKVRRQVELTSRFVTQLAVGSRVRVVETFVSPSGMQRVCVLVSGHEKPRGWVTARKTRLGDRTIRPVPASSPFPAPPRQRQQRQQRQEQQQRCQWQQRRQ